MDTSVKGIARFYRILGTPSRVAILRAISAYQPVSVKKIAQAVSMTHTAVSHQLAILSANSVVKAAREGRHQYYSFAENQRARSVEEHVQKHK